VEVSNIYCIMVAQGKFDSRENEPICWIHF
jgi:hypothetical protein